MSRTHVEMGIAILSFTLLALVIALHQPLLLAGHLSFYVPMQPNMATAGTDRLLSVS